MQVKGPEEKTRTKERKEVSKEVASYDKVTDDLFLPENPFFCCKEHDILHRFCQYEDG